MAMKEMTFGGRIAIVCSRKHGGRREAPQRCECGLPAAYLCDFEVERDGRAVTCDRPLCGQCRRVQSQRTHDRDGVDYCLEHDAIARAPKADANEEWSIGPD